MKRVLLALSLCAPLLAAAETGAKNSFVMGDAAAGATKAAVCGACHGPTGNSANPIWPSLAGQSPAYMLSQLKAFKSGARKDPVMSAQAAPLSEQDMRDLAAHFGSLKMSAGVASKDAVIVAQKLYRAGDSSRKLPACAACHGPTGAGNAAAGYPRVGGQHAAYDAAQLRALRAGERSTSANGQMMAAIAQKLTDTEIEALASYLNGLQ